MKLSIIVPIYNIEDYIEECIESIINQNYSDYEVLLIDDGSKDNSADVCKRYIKDKRIKYFLKDNGGLSDARNFGIEKSTGDYLMFLDGDDFLEENCLNKISGLLNSKNIDFYIFNYKVYDEKNKNTSEVSFNFESNEFDKLDNLKKIEYLFCNNNNTIWSAWRSIVKREFIMRNKIKFEKDIVGAEDCDWFFKCTTLNCKIDVSKESILNYRINRSGSITKELKFDAIYGQLLIFNKWFSIFNKLNNNSIDSYLANKYINVFSCFSKLNDTKFKEIDLYVRNNKEILKLVNGKKQKIVLIIINLLGLKTGCKLIGGMRKIASRI
ncbi:glycosyltransferase family 2 protein [Clostridium perfringens]|nr:glycosyltransferase family 2 protein [Clostridium perfringens]